MVAKEKEPLLSSMSGSGNNGYNNNLHSQNIAKGLQEDIRRAALKYAAAGWPVFPCKRDKSPYTKHGFQDATTDQEQIRTWWGRWPTASIGMPTGKISGTWVLDVDLYKPGCREAFNKLVEKNEKLQTRTQETGGGGVQYFFKHPGGKIPSRSSSLGTGLDIKGDGGYVILPPSGHPSGGNYKWVEEGPSTEAPVWLIELVKERPQGGPVTFNVGNIKAYALKALENEAAKISGAPEGQRNQTLNQAAYSLGQLVAGGELSSSLVENTLADAAQASGLPDREARRTIQSGFKGGRKKPRTAPERNGNSDTYDIPENKVSPLKAGNDGGCGTYGACDADSQSKKIFALPDPPLEIFDNSIRAALKNIAETKKCPIEIPLSALLGMTAGLVGRSRGITIKKGWSESGNLFIATIGRSGSGKGPGEKVIFRSVYQLEQDYQAKFRKEWEQYQIDLENWKARNNKHELPKPQPPVRKDLILDDWTIESLADALVANPGGVLLYRDELAGMLLDLDKYSGEKGATKARLMSSYDVGAPWKIDRVNVKRNSFIPRPCLSIYGGIQPNIAKDLFTSKDLHSGFLGRFIFVQAIQRGPSIFSDEEERPETLSILQRLVDGIDRLPFEGETKYIGVNSEAKKLYANWHDRLAYEAWYAEDDNETGLISKVRAQGLRICLLLHVMEAVLHGKDESRLITPDTMSRALTLMDWLRAHTQATWQMLKQKAQAPNSQEVRIAQAIVEVREQIKNSWLSTSAIAEQVNKNVSRSHQLSKDKIGKICSSLNLEANRTSKARGFIIKPDDIDRLLTFLPEKKTSHVV